MRVSLSAFHWQPVRSTKKIASIAARSRANPADFAGTRGLWHPKGCFGRGGNKASIFAHNSSGKRQPSSRTRRFVVFRPIPFTMDRIWEAPDRLPTEIGPKQASLTCTTDGV